MFHVFGINGAMYHGSHERLSHIAPVRRVQRPQALSTRSADVGAQHAGAQDSAFPSTETTLRRPHTQGAVSAYASTAQGLESERRVLSLVGDVMTRGALTVSARSMVNDAWLQLARARISQAPVLNDAGRVVGLLVRADMAPLDLLPQPGAIQDAIALAKKPVAQVMITPVPTVEPETGVRQLAHVLLETGLPGLPVTNAEGDLVGFVSRTDLLKAMASDPPLDLWS